MIIKDEKTRKIVNTTAIVVSVALCFLGIIMSVLGLGNSHSKYLDVVAIIVYAITILYALFGYNIAHANTMRYVFLAIAFYVVSILADNLENSIPLIQGLLLGLAAILISYEGGRLNKQAQNRILGFIIILLLIAALILAKSDARFAGVQLSGVEKFKPWNSLIMWFASSTIYLARYVLHKKAGEEEDKEEKAKEGK